MQLGLPVGDRVEIVKGLGERERVVSSGTFFGGFREFAEVDASGAGCAERRATAETRAKVEHWGGDREQAHGYFSYVPGFQTP